METGRDERLINGFSVSSIAGKIIQLDLVACFPLLFLKTIFLWQVMQVFSDGSDIKFSFKTNVFETNRS